MFKRNTLLLLIVCASTLLCTPSILAQETKHIFQFGVGVGGQYHLTNPNHPIQGQLGLINMVDFRYGYYQNIKSIDLGFKTGIQAGYATPEYKLSFQDKFTNVDYLGHSLMYTTSGDLYIFQKQATVSIPFVFSLRKNGFVWDIGLRLQTAIYNTGEQFLDNPLIQAYYPAYDVTTTNALVTGKVPENLIYQPLESGKAKYQLFNGEYICYYTTEVGYECRINQKNALCFSAFCEIGLLNNNPPAEVEQIITVSPISDPTYPVAEVSVYKLKQSMIGTYIPLQFGLKVFYTLN